MRLLIKHKKTMLFISAVMIFICVHSVVFAHRVNVFAWIEGDTIYTESYFQDGGAVHEGSIQVLDSSGNIVHRGVTNEEGMYSFTVPLVDDLTIVLDASMGHRATFEIDKKDLAPLSTTPEKTVPREETDTGKSGDTEARTKGAGKDDGIRGRADAGPNETKGLSADEVRAIVREEISTQINPLTRQVAQLRKESGISTREIFAGIGYILGLMGLVMFFQSRRKRT
jgi:nickel transport protein